MDIAQWTAIGLLAFLQARNMLIANRVADLLDTQAKQTSQLTELVTKLVRARK
jgi:hypothetical protein